MDTFAARLKHARRLRGLSQGELARQCGLSQSTISSYESGARKSPTQLLRIAQVLEVSVYWLSRGQGPMTPPLPATLSLNEGGWPFRSISPQQFWTLTATDRNAVEQALSGLIRGLLASRSADDDT